MTDRLKSGDRVRVRLDDDDDWTPAVVALASDSDPSSVMLLLSCAVRAKEGWIAKGLPVMIDYQAEQVVSLWGDIYEIEVCGDELRPGRQRAV